MLAHTVSFYLRFSVFAGKVWLNASLKRETFKEKFPKLVSYLGYIWSFARFYLLLPMAMSIQIQVFFKSELYSCIFLRIMNCESWLLNLRIRDVFQTPQFYFLLIFCCENFSSEIARVLQNRPNILWKRQSPEYCGNCISTKFPYEKIR